MNKTDLAWAAGFFDGEGCVYMYISKGHGCRGRYWAGVLTACNTDFRAIKRLQLMFGGTVNLRDNSKRPNARPIALWVIRYGAATKAAKCLLLYSLVKREQLEIFITFREMIERNKVNRGNVISMQELKARKLLIKRVTDLKHISHVM